MTGLKTTENSLLAPRARTCSGHPRLQSASSGDKDVDASGSTLRSCRSENAKPLRDLRAAIVTEAISWIGTPFHHAGRIKGAGVDCLMLLAEVYERAGITTHIEPPFYVPDWHLHRDAERYLDGLRGHASEIEGPPQGPEPLPGDIALFRFGRTFSHGAIVIEWPRLVHAYWAARIVTWADATLYPLAGRPVKFFTPFESPYCKPTAIVPRQQP